MSTKRKRCFLLIKDKQTIISHSEESSRSRIYAKTASPTPQMSDEQILATVVGHASECEISDEEGDAWEDDKQVSNSEAIFKNLLKNACPGWKARAILTLIQIISFNE